MAAQPDEDREQLFREQLFTERYANLRVWAIHLTNQESAADDLVQDAFVQWMLVRTRLEEIENIDGYLRTMLRNMHFARLSRAAQRLQETTLSIADYDSSQLGWAAVEPPRRMQASEELHQICAYVCFRKESSKAASVLILRFFHNYFPTEIAGVLNSSRNSVDQWQRLARREAKLFMNRPGGLRFVNGGAPARHTVRYLRSDGDLMLDLRQLIFNSCRGDCLSQSELHEAYTRNNDETLTTAKLAHIVSCPKCLDVVNRMLGLPLLAERHPAESTDRNEPPDDAKGNGASGGGPGALKRKLAHRLRETHEHKPQELRIAVNGLLVSTIKISAELSELDLNLPAEDPVEFVEIFSEQGIQLLFFSINSNEPRYEQWAWMELSESRLLEATYKDHGGPRLHVLYKEPAANEARSPIELTEINATSSPLSVVPDLDVLRESNVGAPRDLRARVVRFTNTLRALVTRLPIADEAQHNSPGNRTTSDGLVFLNSLGESHRHSRWRFALIALACVVVAAGFLLFKARLSRELNATDLLERATRAEELVHNTPDRISHRFIDLEERRSTGGSTVARRKIEIWQHHANGDSARRLYDESSQLIGGAWEKSNGSRTVFHHGAKPRPETALASPSDLLFNLEDIWQLEPSVRSFSALIGEPAVVDVEERSTSYVLTFDKERTIGASRLLKATLTLSKSDLHAIEQTLLVQRGNESRDYRFVEAGAELLPVRAVAPGVFEIETELNGGAADPGRPGNWANRDLTSNHVPTSLNTSAPPAASAELEVDVAYLLNRAKADRNEQVTLTRSAGGSLRVEGIVDSDERKQEFLRAFAPVSNNPAVKIEIRTVAEATKRSVALNPALVQEAEETVNVVAADDELRAYYDKRGIPGPTDDAIRKYSSRVVSRAYAALFHAIELKRLVSRFANVDMQTVAPGAREKWLGMLHEHAAAFEKETAALRQEIQPVFFPGASAPGSEGGVINSDADLARAVERLHRLGLSNNDAVRSAFTTSSQSSAVAVKSAGFWQALFKAEELARKIQQYQVD
ncbi:MAG TPA: RNA polymerase sigma factor [Pyrinomonadaceae bacterium]|nr:RNA polymerase sigma factor [Pyrinomonadaceae bacterium]